MIESLAQFANSNTSLRMRGRHISMDILVGIGDDDFIITLEKGRVIDIQPRRVSLESGIFAIRAAEEVWAEHWQSIPKRDYHDLFSMVSAGLANVDGDLRPFMQKLLYFKALLESPRPDLDNKYEKSVISSPEFEPIIGRYFTMQFDGRGYRICVEEAGEGIPLVCLHTGRFGRTPVSSSDDGSGNHRPLPRNYL